MASKKLSYGKTIVLKHKLIDRRFSARSYDETIEIKGTIVAIPIILPE
jgi:hypothetical protein